MLNRHPGELSRRTFIAVSAAVLATACMRDGHSGGVRLAAGDPGGLYLAFAILLAARFQGNHPDATVEVLPTEGTIDNLGRLRTGQSDMGLALADVAERDRATGPAQTAPLAVARVYENYLQVIVRDSAAVHQISDLSGTRVSIGPAGSGGAITARVLLEAAGLQDRIDMRRYTLGEGLARLADGGVDALVWSGGIPTPAISDLDTRMPLRMLDIGELARAMSDLGRYPYVVHRVPAGAYVPPSIRSIGVPNLLLCRPDSPTGLVVALVELLATDAAQLVPPYVRGLQYLDTPSMIQTGAIPLHPDAIRAYRRLHG